MAKKEKRDSSLYSRYWFDDDSYSYYSTDNYYGISSKRLKELDAEEKKSEEERLRNAERIVELIKLGAFMRSCGNFVRILTGRDDIVVKYEEGDASYTDGKTVTLSSKVEDNFDSTVGLALHEASHIVKTDMNFVPKIIESWKEREKYISGEMVKKIIEINPKIEKWNWAQLMKDSKIVFNFKSGTKPVQQAAEVFLTIQFKEIWNWIEDRRIDKWVRTTAEGYSGYYDALYERYFLNNEVDKELKKDKLYKEETFDSYSYRIFNLMNNNNNLDSLKGLREIEKLIDWKHIDRLNNCYEVADLTKGVIEIILKNITSLDFKSVMLRKFQLDSACNDDGMGIDLDKLTDEQIKEIFGMSRKQLEKLLKKMQEQKDFANGDVQKRKLTASEAKQMQSLQNIGVTLDLVGGDDFNGQYIQTVFIEKLTDAVIESSEFGNSFHSHYYGRSYYSNEEAIKQGFILGRLLGRRLQIRNEEKTLKFTRKDSGKIDKRLVSNLGYGVENIFSKVETSKYEKAHIHLSIDASGSMNGQRIFKAIKTSIAIAVASKMISNVEVVISFRSTTTTNLPLVYIAYDSRVNGFSHIRKYFKLIHANSSTPESLCYPSIMNRSFPKIANGENFYFVNLSDGEPAHSVSGSNGHTFSYHGESAYRHCKKMINKMVKDFGATIISYLISDGHESLHSLKKMYGNNNAFNINTDNVEQIARVMNRKFLENSGSRNSNDTSLI